MLSLIFEGKTKSFRDTQKLEMFSITIGFIRNVKGTSLSEKLKTTVRNTKITKEKASWFRPMHSKCNRSTTFNNSKKVRRKVVKSFIFIISNRGIHKSKKLL